MFQYTPDVAVVNADSDVKAPRDLVDAAKAALKRVIFSDSGEGSANLPAEVQFDTLAGAQTTYVSFKYTGAAVTALQGNQFAEEWRYRTVGADQGDKVCILPVAMEKRHPPAFPIFRRRELASRRNSTQSGLCGR